MDIYVWISGYYKPNVFSNHFLWVLILQFCCYHCLFLPELILQLLLLLLFSGTPYDWFPYYINFYAWSAQEVFVAEHMYWFFKFTCFPMVFLVYDLNLVPQRAAISLLSPATPDFSTSLRVTAFWCSWSLTLRERSVSPLYFLLQLHGVAYTQSLVMFSSMGGSYSVEISAKSRQTFEGCPGIIWTTDPLYFLW